MFFSFDGIDGAGKSTQMDLFCSWLEGEKNRTVVRCREPGGTDLGERIRDILLSQTEISICLESELFLFMSSRAQLVKDVIRPALAEGNTVVCDRFLLASIVYQGHAGGLDPEWIRSIGSKSVGATLPDLTFVFHLDPLKAQQRIGPSTDRIESRSIEFLTKVNTGFVTEGKSAGDSVQLIDANESVENIHTRIIESAQRLF